MADRSLIARLLEYQAVCNRFASAEAITYYTDDAVCRIDRLELVGKDDLFDLHEYDRGCAARIILRDLRLRGDNQVSALLVHETELDRNLGIPGLARWSTATFHGDLIARLEIQAPTVDEHHRWQKVIAPVLDWAQRRHPALAARVDAGPVYDAGVALAQIARLWRDHPG